MPVTPRYALRASVIGHAARPLSPRRPRGPLLHPRRLTCARRFISPALVVCLAIPALAFGQAQITTGVIQGVVRDATGAILPGVNVEVQNVETNQSAARVTDDTGRFVVLQLPPGSYRVSFALAGFSTLVQEDVGLTVGQTVNLNPRMTVSAVQETVTVSGTAGMDTSRAGATTH